MPLRPIYNPKFCSTDCDLRFFLEISPNKTLELACSIEKVENAWKVRASIVCMIIRDPHKTVEKFKCQLPTIVLKPTEIKVIGAWRDFFLQDSYCPVPQMVREDISNHSIKLDPIDSLEDFANERLLEITAYENGITVKSEYLKLEEKE